MPAKQLSKSVYYQAGAVLLGYGKSTVITHWLEEENVPSAWASVDDEDNDLRVFLSYLVTAIRTLSPKACKGYGGVDGCFGDALDRDSFRKPWGGHAMRNPSTIRVGVLHSLSRTMTEDETPLSTMAQMACQLYRVRSSVRRSALAFKGA